MIIIYCTIDLFGDSGALRVDLPWQNAVPGMKIPFTTSGDCRRPAAVLYSPTNL
jgi:hypothetical protein